MTKPAHGLAEVLHLDRRLTVAAMSAFLDALGSLQPLDPTRDATFGRAELAPYLPLIGVPEPTG